MIAPSRAHRETMAWRGIALRAKASVRDDAFSLTPSEAIMKTPNMGP